MKKILKTLLITFLFIPMLIYGEEKKLNIYLFYGNKCPHCAELEKFLNKAVPIVNSMANQYNSRLEPSKPKDKIEFLKPYQLLFPRSKSVGFAYVYYVE